MHSFVIIAIGIGVLSVVMFDRDSSFVQKMILLVLFYLLVE